MATITIDQLNKTETLEKVREVARDYIIHEAMPESWNLINKLESQIKSLSDSSPEIYKQYLKILVQLKFVAIPFQTDDQILELIRKFFLTVLKEGLDIERRIRVYLASKSVFNRDQFKKDVLTSLKQNQEKLENKTVGEWLLAYDRFAGARKNTSIERTKFITQDLETIKLSDESKQLLSRLLEFYDNLKITVPLPFIGVSEVTLAEFFKEMGIPSPEEEGKKAILSKIIKVIPPEELIEEPKPIEPIKPKKPKIFERLFKKKPERLEEKIEKEKIETAPKKISVYEEKISPYEKRREFPITEKEISTFPEKIAPPPTGEPEGAPAPPIAKQAPPIKLQYKIRTMKQDIEKAKKEPIPEK